MAVVTVSEVLTLPILSGTKVLAGASGLTRPVTGVNVMEVPDIEAFVKGGELLLTTTYPLREHPEQLGDLVTTLHLLGVAALAVKTGRYIDRLPEDMLAAADELSFPVLEVPEALSFNEVIGALLAVVLTEYGADPGRAEAIRERLTGVALSGGGLTEIARTLAGAIERPVEIVDSEGVVLGQSNLTLSDGPSWDFPVTVAGSRRGRIRVGGEAEPTLVERRLIRQAGFAAGMHVAQALASIDLDRHIRVLFLEDLVTGKSLDAALTRERSRLFGWDFATSHAVLLARLSVEIDDSLVVSAAEAGLPRGSVAWARGHEALALVPTTPSADLGAIARIWHSALAALGSDRVIVAAGPSANRAEGFPRSHQLAREALAVATSVGEPAVAYDDLALERLLLSAPAERLKELVSEEIGPLIHADQQSHGELCHTLEVYLGIGNAAEAARQLFIHYNTMKHRLHRITELLGVDLHDPRSRLTLSLALVARNLLRSPGDANGPHR